MLHEEDDGTESTTIAEFERQIVETLFECYCRIAPLMTFDSLTSFPDAIQSYVSFVAFLINSYEKEIILLMNSEKRPIVFLLLEHLVHCSIHADASTGQLALKSIESFAEILWRSKFNVDAEVLERVYSCEGRLMDWMLGKYLAVNNSQDVISDRFDAFAYALLSLIRLAPERFRAQLDAAMNSYPASASIINSFLSRLNFDLSILDRSNRRLFNTCLREFSDELKSQMAFISSQIA